jgi:hypothetical protein
VVVVKQPVFAPYHKRFHSPLCTVVVYIELAVFCITATLT